MRRYLACSGLMLLACVCMGDPSGGEDAVVAEVATLTEVGIVPRPPGHAGRDVGFSGMLGGRSVWIFGDTFLPARADDGLRWRSSSWSWTMGSSISDGIGPFEHAVDEAGLAIQLLPHTAEEAAYNLAHEDHEGCRAKSQCGSRLTPWPGALVTDRDRKRAIIYYSNMQTGPDGGWDFKTVSGSVATWEDPDKPAKRVEPPLFGDEEPDWGAAAVLVDDLVYVYACEFNGNSKPCLLARVPFEAATDRQRYRFWAGSGEWSPDWQDAVPLFDGGSLFSVHYNAYLQKYLAFYLPGLDRRFQLRTAERPQGPWSEAVGIGEGKPAEENWNYALIAHPEFSRDNGRVEVLSYTRPSGVLTQETRLVEVHLNKVRPATQ